MRLNKYLAAAGIASRRKCDELILSGLISVNGRTDNLLGLDVDANADEVVYNGSTVKLPENKEYIILNKPQGYICSCADDKQRRTVMELIPDGLRLFPVGRLDYDTEGLLILTNDGDLAQKLTHPKHRVLKEYYVEVEGKILSSDLELLKNGVVLDDGKKTLRAKVNLKSSGKISRLYITIGEGRNRQVRRMMEALGFNVLYLCRTQIGNIKLEQLDLGQYRKLSDEETEYLRTL